MKKLSFLLLGLVLIILAACSDGGNSSDANSNDDVKVMKFGSVAARDQPISQGAIKFGELVEEYTDGSVEVEIHTDGSLGGDLEMLDSLRAGTLEATNISTGPISSLAPTFAVFDLPFLFDNEDIAYEVLDGEIGDKVLDDLSGTGIVGLGYWENGFRYLTNDVREVKSVDDVKGLQLRTLEVDMYVDTWEELGANPVPLAFTELFTALESGTVDGQEGTYPNTRYNGLHEVQTYFTDTGHVYNPSVMLISESFWDELTDAEQEALQKASDEARDYQRELSREDNDDSHRVMEEEGLIMTELTPEARQEFIDKMQPIYDKYRSQLGEELVDEVLEAVGK